MRVVNKLLVNFPELKDTWWLIASLLIFSVRSTSCQVCFCKSTSVCINFSHIIKKRETLLTLTQLFQKPISNFLHALSKAIHCHSIYETYRNTSLPHYVHRSNRICWAYIMNILQHQLHTKLNCKSNFLKFCTFLLWSRCWEQKFKTRTS